MICVRVNRGAKKDVQQAAFLHLQQLGIIQTQVNVVSLDSTCIKVHPDGMGALKKADHSLLGEREADEIPSFIWSPHLIEMGQRWRCPQGTTVMLQKAAPFCGGPDQHPPGLSAGGSGL